MNNTNDTISPEKNRSEENILETKNIHDILTLASIVELEGTNAENRKKIAGVFYNRLDKKMTLGSDVTTYYAVQKDMTEVSLFLRISCQTDFSTKRKI